MQTNLNLAIKIDNNGTYKILSCVMRFFRMKEPKTPARTGNRAQKNDDQITHITRVLRNSSFYCSERICLNIIIYHIKNDVYKCMVLLQWRKNLHLHTNQTSIILLNMLIVYLEFSSSYSLSPLVSWKEYTPNNKRIKSRFHR